MLLWSQITGNAKRKPRLTIENGHCFFEGQIHKMLFQTAVVAVRTDRTETARFSILRRSLPLANYSQLSRSRDEWCWSMDTAQSGLTTDISLNI